MGTISARKRANGTVAYTAQIRIKRDGKVIYSQAETFRQKQGATLWLRKRESELDAPGALDRAIAEKNIPTTATLGDAIGRYIEETGKVIGRTKAQVLEAIKRDEIAGMACRAVTSDMIVAYGKRLFDGGRKPQTVANYMSHLSAVMTIGRPAWKFELDPQQMADAQAALGKLGLVSKSAKRSRRPTLEELDTLLSHYQARVKQAPRSVPMHIIIAFAIFSTRRQEEIVTIKWDNYDKAQARILVHDMKHPGQKIGNDVWCDLPDLAAAIIDRMPKKEERIFPFSTDAVTASFTRACKLLGIDDLHFHDLRHDGVSRLFELGHTIPRVAAVSGHRSWSSLQRYTHLKQTGDKYDRWPWLEKLGIGPAKPDAAEGMQ